MTDRPEDRRPHEPAQNEPGQDTPDPPAQGAPDPPDQGGPGQGEAPAQGAQAAQPGASTSAQPPRRPLWAGALLRPTAADGQPPAPAEKPTPSPLELLRATAPDDDLTPPSDGDWRRGGLVTRSRLKAASGPPRAWDEIGAVVSATQILRNPMAPMQALGEADPDDTLTDEAPPFDTTPEGAPPEHAPPEGVPPEHAPNVETRPDGPSASPSAAPTGAAPSEPHYAPLPFDPDGRRLGSDWLVHYARRKASGRLTLTRRGTTARVQLDHGRAVRVRLVPERPDESLGRLLLARGLLTPAQAERARAYAEQTSCLFGVAALRTTDVAPHAIVKALMGRLKGRLKALAVEPPEGVSFEPLAAPDKGAIPSGVSVEPLVFDALLRRYAGRTPRAMAAQEAELAGHFVFKQPSLPPPAEAAALDPDERALWESLGEEAATLRQVNQRSPLPPRRTHATLFALRDLGYLALEAAPPRPSGADRYVALLRRDPAATGTNRSPFDVLGVHWSVDGPGLEAFYEQRRANLRRARPSGPLGPAAQALEAAVATNLEAAMETLRSADARRAARRAVASAQQIAQAAEHYVSQGDMAVFRGNATGAAEDYRRALDLVPRQPDATRKLARVLPSSR